MGVHHGGPINVDVVFITELEEVFLVDYVSLSMIIEFGTPKRWMMSRKNSMACSNLIVEIDQASVHFVNLSTVTSKYV